MEAGTLTVVIVIAVIFVNGATDAPNSVAGAVSDGTLSYPAACTVCAVFNFAGMLLSSMFFPSVEASMASLTSGGVAGVQIALVSVVLFSSAAWFFGIPTSESHGLIASLGGVSLYYSGTAGDAFLDITLKSVVSCIVGFFVGFVFLFLMRPMFGDRGFFREKGRRSTLAAMCAGGASFCHGMQDGQKFMAMLAVGTGAAEHRLRRRSFVPRSWLAGALRVDGALLINSAEISRKLRRKRPVPHPISEHSCVPSRRLLSAFP